MIGWLRQKHAKDERLIGRWLIDPTDTAAVKAFGQVEIEFDDAGNLNYLINAEDKVEAILLTYRVEGDVLVTNQPSHPHADRTVYRIKAGALTLTFGGVPSRFLRIDSNQA